MADNDRDLMSETGQQRRNETSDGEHQRVRSSNDRDQAMEREGVQSEHNRGYDDAADRGIRNDDQTDRGDVDPDSAEADIDRDDTISD